jgi:hypothetical protein
VRCPKVEGAPYRITVPPKVQPGQPFYVRVPRSVAATGSAPNPSAHKPPLTTQMQRPSSLPPLPTPSPSQTPALPASLLEANDAQSSAGKSSSSSSSFAPGARAIVTGLLKMPSSNGRPCAVLGFDDGVGRFRVHFTDSEGGLGCLKAENLRPDSAGAAATVQGAVEATTAARSREKDATAHNGGKAAVAATDAAAVSSAPAPAAVAPADEAPGATSPRGSGSGLVCRGSRKQRAASELAAAHALEVAALRRELAACSDALDCLRDQRLYGPAMGTAALRPTAAPRLALAPLALAAADGASAAAAGDAEPAETATSLGSSGSSGGGVSAAAALGAGELLLLLAEERLQCSRAEAVAAAATVRAASLEANVGSLVRVALRAGASAAATAASTRGGGEPVGLANGGGKPVGLANGGGKSGQGSEGSKDQGSGVAESHPGDGSGAAEVAALIPAAAATAVPATAVPATAPAAAPWAVALRAAVAAHGDALAAQREEVATLQVRHRLPF